MNKQHIRIKYCEQLESVIQEADRIFDEWTALFLDLKNRSQHEHQLSMLEYQEHRANEKIISLAEQLLQLL